MDDTSLREEDTPLLLEKSKQVEVTAPPSSTLAVLAVFLFPALGGLLFGYDIGATSAVMEQLESSTYSGVDWYYYIADSSVLQGLITSIGIAGAMIGSMICFKVGDDLGRRKELLIAAVLYFSGGLLEAQSGAFSNLTQVKAALTMLVAGRVVFGLACGFAMHGAPAYIAEMAPSSIRGLLISLKEAFIVIGILLGYVLGYIYDETVSGWRFVYGASMLIAAAMFAGMLTLPPSSRWLVLKGRNDEAWNALTFVTPGASQADFNDVVKSLEDSVAESKDDDGNWNKLVEGPCRLALIAGCGVVILQQITGQPSVLYYADSIFEDVGLGSIASVLVGAFKLFATLYAVFTVDSQGRKKLLYIGVSMMLVALIVLAVAFAFPYSSTDDCNSLTLEDDCSDQCSWSSSDCVCDDTSTDTCTCCGVGSINFQKASILGAMFLYIGGYQVGFGPIAWLLISEVFPLELRGKAISIAVVVNFFTMTLMTFEFPVEIELVGTSITFAIFAVIDAYALYFIYQNVPETKGLSLEQIEQYFAQKFHTQKKASGSDKAFV